MSAQNDTGSQTIQGVVRTGQAVHASFKAAQAASPVVISAGKGAWDITSTAGKATITLARTASVLSSGFVPFTAKSAFIQQANATGLLNTATSQRIVKTVSQIKATAVKTEIAVEQSVKAIKTGISYTKKAAFKTAQTAQRTYNLVRGLANGTVLKGEIAHKVLKNIKSKGLKGLKSAKKGFANAAKATGKAALKGAKWTVRTGLPKAAKASVKATGKMSLGIGGALASSGDDTLRTTGRFIQGATYGVKTANAARKVAWRGAKTTVKGGIKTVRGVRNAVGFIRHNGLRAAWVRARAAFARAGKSVVTAMLNLAKGVGSKFAVPLILIVAVVSAFSGLLSAPLAAVGSIFGGVFDFLDYATRTWKEYDTREYLEQNLSEAIQVSVDNIADELVRGVTGIRRLRLGGEDNILLSVVGYDRIYTDTESFVEYNYDTLKSEIDRAIYSDEELLNVITPIFQSYMFLNNELKITGDLGTAQKLLRDILQYIFVLRTDSEYGETEYCGQSLFSGEGTARSECTECGRIHATDDCVFFTTGVHTEYTCSGCCTKDAETGEFVSCSGYKYCLGHSTITYATGTDGFFNMLYQVFESPLDALANKEGAEGLTEEEKEKLSTTIDCYDVCVEMIKEATDEAIGFSKGSLANVDWAVNQRQGNNRLAELALNQNGVKKGEDYWSYCGYSSRVEWSSCFVSWCMREVGYNANFSTNEGARNYYESRSMFVDSNHADIAAGDIIFIDYSNYGYVERVGVVIGSDDEYVYCMIGNCGDKCRLCKFRLDNGIIMGYGLN